jgi:hypothetical protein
LKHGTHVLCAVSGRTFMFLHPKRGFAPSRALGLKAGAG